MKESDSSGEGRDEGLTQKVEGVAQKGFGQWLTLAPPEWQAQAHSHPDCMHQT